MLNHKSNNSNRLSEQFKAALIQWAEFLKSAGYEQSDSNQIMNSEERR